MRITTKSYCITKTNFFVKDAKLFFVFNGINRESNDWIIVEQKLKKAQIFFYKVLNKIIKKTMQNSIYTNMSALINSITYLFSLKTVEIAKHTLLNSFKELIFAFLSIKINNKVYSKEQVEDIFILKYDYNVLTLFKFGITSVKQNYI